MNGLALVKTVYMGPTILFFNFFNILIITVCLGGDFNLVVNLKMDRTTPK